VTEVAAFAAWLGAAVIVLSDGRRGLALGLIVVSISFGVLAWVGGERLAAGAVLLGGAVAAVARLRAGRDAWVFMPPGSTPRLVLSIGAGLFALWIATSVITGPGAQLRFAALSVLGLMAARVISAAESSAVLTAIAALALSVAMAAGVADTSPGPVPYVAAALLAAGISLVRVTGPNGT
jgi:hypothetical protein